MPQPGYQTIAISLSNCNYFLLNYFKKQRQLDNEI